ncbi:MAG: hypothetical protein HY914_13270 [Desulfomonile tiedjei]|nr:hypothetical protein [Desulfomonile tiedjei]
MGEWYQMIVDEEASEEDAPVLASSIRDWLVAEGIIEGTPTDCLLSEEKGYPPGPNHIKAADAGLGDDYMFRFGINGMEIITERTVFHTMGFPFELLCADCGHLFEPPYEWGDAVTEWYVRTGPGNFPCPQCGVERSITEWQYDPPWGFGNLGFKFWNWPPFEPWFVEEVSRRLGHPVVVVDGKL